MAISVKNMDAETLFDFKHTTTLYDSMIEHLTEVARNKQKLDMIIKEIVRISDKNADVLQTNIVGYPLLINDRDQKAILDIIGYSKQEVIDICNKSGRLDGIGKIIDQFSFALPLLLLSGILKKENKEEYGKSLFLFTFYRPYASKVSMIFKYGTVDENAMNYTTNVELNDKSYIHKYGTVYNVLVQSAKTAYDAYIDIISGINEKPSDDILYNNIFYSSIFSKTGSWISSLYGTYKKVKTSGKALNYEQSFYKTTSDDSGDEYEDNPIQSDSAVKQSYVSKAITKFSISPVDSKLVSVAARYGFNGNTSPLYEGFIIQTIKKVSEKNPGLVSRLFDAIVGSYLDTSDDDTGIRHNSSEISTIKFLAYCKKNIKTSHTINNNIKEMKNILEEILLTCCDKYIVCKSATQTTQMRTAVFMYFVYFVQKA